MNTENINKISLAGNKHYEKAHCSNCNPTRIFPSFTLAPEPPFDYAATGTGKILTAPYLADFIADQTTIGCEFSYTIGTAGDCSKPYSGDKIWVDTTNGDILAKENIFEGYSETICIRIHIPSNPPYDLDNFLITQNMAPNYFPYCESKLTVDEVITQAQDYSDTKIEETYVESENEVFQNQDDANCVIKKCKIFEKDCLTPINTMNINLAAN